MTSPIHGYAPFWREWTWWLLILFVLASFFVNLDRMPLVGEETRRALIAREMVQTDDWIVPRQQGIPRLTKPPIQYWAIALSTQLFGEESRWTIRLPSVLAILLTCMVIYGYCRQWLSAYGALAAGISFATMLDVLHSGRLAQIDAIFTMFLSSALLVWHWGYSRNWSEWLIWGLSYGLAAMATLTKGPQAPVYFMAGVGFCLLVQRDWRFLFSWTHLWGLFVYVAILASWLVPFWWDVGTSEMVRLFLSEASIRSNVFQQSFWGHAFRFPIDSFFSLFPASLLLPLFLSRRLWQSMGLSKRAAWFLIGCIGLAYPTCWLAPGGEIRYLMPIYPCLACLVGIGIETLWKRAPSNDWLSNVPFMMGWGAVATLLLTAVGVLVIAVTPWSEPFGKMTLGHAGIMSLVILGMAFAINRSLPTHTALITHLLFGCFLAILYNGLMIPRLSHLCRDMAQEVAPLREKLPANEPLTSLHWVHHRFAFHYPYPINTVAWPQEWPREGSLFCFDGGLDAATLPFPWVVVANVPVDRYRKSGPPKEWVVVARRLPPPSE